MNKVEKVGYAVGGIFIVLFMVAIFIDISRQKEFSIETYDWDCLIEKGDELCEDTIIFMSNEHGSSCESFAHELTAKPMTQTEGWLNVINKT